jgi:hypothetical protein
MDDSKFKTGSKIVFVKKMISSKTEIEMKGDKKLKARKFLICL